MASEWPDSFTYVCNSGRSGIVNALPIAHAGLDAIHRVVVFCGASGLATTNAHERAEALLPALALRDAVDRWSHGEISEAQGTFQIVYGPSSDIGVWSAQMRAVIADEQTRYGDDARILFNLKGGTKEMTIGAMLALFSAPEQQAVLVTVGDRPLRVDVVGADLQDPLSNQGFNLSLSQYLEVYGFCEHIDDNPARRRASFEAECLISAAALKSFGRTLLPDAVRAWPLLQELSRPIELANNTNRLGINILAGGHVAHLENRDHYASKVLRLALSKLAGASGFKIEHDDQRRCTSCTIETQFAARFVRGAWLEALLFLEITELAKGRPDVEVAGNLGLAYRGKAHERVTEIDVAVVARSQLLVIEAKSSSMTNKAARESGERSFAQLDSNKRQILGQVGPAIVVNPCVHEEEMANKSGAIGERLRRGGEEAFLGPDAVQKALKRVKSFIG